MSCIPLWPEPARAPRRAEAARIARGLARLEVRAERCNAALTELVRRRGELMDRMARLGRGGTQ